MKPQSPSEIKETGAAYSALKITQEDLEVKLDSATSRATSAPKPGTPEFTEEMLTAFAEGKRQALIRRRIAG